MRLSKAKVDMALIHDCTASPEETPFLDDSTTKEHIQRQYARDCDQRTAWKLRISLFTNIVLMMICVALSTKQWVSTITKEYEIAEPYCR